MLGRIVNATTLRHSPIQGRLVHVGRRGYGPRPNELVAVVVGTHARRYETYVCRPGSVRLAQSVTITIEPKKEQHA